MGESAEISDAVALGKWDGAWSEIRGSSNALAPKEHLDMFEFITDDVRPIWEAPILAALKSAASQGDRAAFKAALSRAVQGGLSKEAIASAQNSFERCQEIPCRYPDLEK